VVLPRSNALVFALAALALGSGCSLGSGSPQEAEEPAAGISTRASDAALAATSGTHDVRIGSVRIRIRTEPSGVVCYWALRRPNATTAGSLRACVRRLGADEISYAIGTRRTGQQMLAGVAGDRVSRVLVRLTPRRVWAAPIKDGAFFGYIPSDYRADEVVKVLDDGSREVFSVSARR
jgi:hypothetical protein